MVHNMSSSADVTLAFPESCKVSSVPPTKFFRTTNGPAYLAFQAYKDNLAWDEMELRFISGASNNATDAKDVKKFSNMTMNFYTIAPDNTQLLADARDPDSLYPGYVIPMGISSSLLYTYKLVVTHYDQQPGITIYLRDNYTNTTTLLQDSTVYPVILNADTASQGNNRLQLIFGSTTGVNSITQQSENAIKIFPNPANDEINVSFSNHLPGNTAIEVINTLGQTVKTINTGNSAGNINILIEDLSAGVYIVKTVWGGKIISGRFIKN
jgi:hypothetical protein